MFHKINMPSFPVEILPDWSVIPFNFVTTATLLFFFVTLTLIESQYPKIKMSVKSWYRSYSANTKLFIFNSTILSLLPLPALMFLADTYTGHEMLKITLPYAWKIVLAFLLLDIMFYCWHKAFHSFDLLWELHKIHHCDPNLNVSTSFRVHVVELIISTTIKSACIIFLGLDTLSVLMLETVTTLFVMFHHTNIALPGEHLLSRIIIVPSLHRVHHSKRREEHDNNYGAVLSIWDRLFGTLAMLEPEEIGIKGKPPLDFLGLLKFGFISNSHGSSPETDLQPMIAEAAYFIAKSRGFCNGHDIDNWLQAEQEVISRKYEQKQAKRAFIYSIKDLQFPSFSLFPTKPAYGF